MLMCLKWLMVGVYICSIRADDQEETDDADHVSEVDVVNDESEGLDVTDLLFEYSAYLCDRDPSEPELSFQDYIESCYIAINEALSREPTEYANSLLNPDEDEVDDDDDSDNEGAEFALGVSRDGSYLIPADPDLNPTTISMDALRAVINLPTDSIDLTDDPEDTPLKAPTLRGNHRIHLTTIYPYFLVASDSYEADEHEERKEETIEPAEERPCELEHYEQDHVELLSSTTSEGPVIEVTRDESADIFRKAREHSDDSDSDLTCVIHLDFNGQVYTERFRPDETIDFFHHWATRFSPDYMSQRHFDITDVERKRIPADSLLEQFNHKTLYLTIYQLQG